MPVLGLDRHVADAHDEGLGVERLPGVPGRAGLLAAAAFGAGEAVEEVLPAEVLERLEPERGVSRLEVHLGSSPRGASLRNRCWGSSWRCAGASRTAGSEERRDRGDVAHHRSAKTVSSGIGRCLTQWDGEGVGTNAPGCRRSRDLRTSANSSVATTPPIIPRIRQRVPCCTSGEAVWGTRRWRNAQPIETRTMTTTMYHRGDRGPEHAVERIDARACWMTPPVTMSGVPIDEAAPTQKIARRA